MRKRVVDKALKAVKGLGRVEVSKAEIGFLRPVSGVWRLFISSKLL